MRGSLTAKFHKLDSGFLALREEPRPQPPSTSAVSIEIAEPPHSDASQRTPSITVCVATFGTERWREAGRRAFESLLNQSDPPNEIIWVHGESLAHARNTAGLVARSEHLVFVDADDRLDRDYVRHMRPMVQPGRLVQPAQSLSGRQGTFVAQPLGLRVKNFLIIGTAVPREIFCQVGGFRTWHALEDWDLWVRCWLAGASLGVAEQAIYVIGDHRDSPGRNQRASWLLKRRIRRSWNHLPFEFGGLRQPSLADELILVSAGSSHRRANPPPAASRGPVADQGPRTPAGRSNSSCSRKSGRP